MKALTKALLLAATVALARESARADMTLLLDDGLGHTTTFSDSGSGFIYFNGALANSVWTANIDVALSKPVIGGQFDPRLDLSIQSDSSSAAGTLTITVVSTGFGPLPNDTGLAELAAGGASGGTGRTISGSGQVNGSTVVTLGEFTSDPWSGEAVGLASGLASPFNIGETIVITHAGALAGPKGDFSLSFLPVPEPPTILAGSLLLLPLGLSAYRIMRRKAVV